MTLKELYQKRKAQPVPGVAFVREVATVTNRAESSVYRWLLSDVVPDATTQQVLAEHFGTTPEELFPVTSKA